MRSAPGSSAELISFQGKAGLYFQLRSQGLNVLRNLGDIWQWASGQPSSDLHLTSCPLDSRTASPERKADTLTFGQALNIPPFPLGP